MEENTEVTPAHEELTQVETIPEVIPPSEPVKPNYERAAAKYGHKNLDDWTKSGRDPDEWVTAEDFVRNYTWSREIKKLKDVVENKTKSIDVLMEYNSKIEQKAYDRARLDLEKRLEDAAVIGDANSVKAINKEIVDLQVEQTKATAPQQTPNNLPLPEYVNEFQNRNYQWFNNNSTLNKAMTSFAINRELELQAHNPGMDPRLILRMVEDDVKKTYPSQFTEKASTQVTTPQTTSVEAGVNRSMKANKELTLKDLPKEDQEIAERVKRTTKSFDEKDFLAAYKQANGIR